MKIVARNFLLYFVWYPLLDRKRERVSENDCLRSKAQNSFSHCNWLKKLHLFNQ